MDYEEVGRSTKSIAIIGGCVVLVLGIIIFFFISSKNDVKDTNLRPKLVCTDVDSNDMITFEKKIEVYDKDNSLDIVQSINTKYRGNKNFNISQDYINSIKSQLDSKFNLLIGDGIDGTDVYKTNISKNDNQIKITVHFYINKLTELIYTNYFEFNMLDSSLEEIRDYIKQGGYTCEK